jgi:hypothetical protein
MATQAWTMPPADHMATQAWTMPPRRVAHLFKGGGTIGERESRPHV